MCSECARKKSEYFQNLALIPLRPHSEQIPRIPSKFRSELLRIARIRSETVGESKVLAHSRSLRNPNTRRDRDFWRREGHLEGDPTADGNRRYGRGSGESGQI